MTRIALLLALFVGALPAPARSAEPQKAPRVRKVKVVVLPFQAITADVPARSGPRVTARIAAEVHAAEGLKLVDWEAAAAVARAEGGAAAVPETRGAGERTATPGTLAAGETSPAPAVARGDAKNAATPAAARGDAKKDAATYAVARGEANGSTATLAAANGSGKAPTAGPQANTRDAAQAATVGVQANTRDAAQGATAGSQTRALDGMQLPAEEALNVAREAVKEATTAREARDFKRADAALGRALDAYAAGAAQLTDASELADAYALRAAVRYATGRDEEAAASLTQALALAPNRPLPLAATSPLFAKTVERVRAAQESGPRGGVRFESVPSGLAVTLDGRPVGNAPLRVTDVPPGAHLWRAVLPSGDAVGGIVEVTPDRQALVQVRPAGSGPDAALALALASNRLDAAALEAASAMGRAAGADLVVLGTVARVTTGLAVDAFVLAPGDTAPRRLARMSVDTELLEANAPLREGIAAVAARGVEAGVTEALPVVPVPGVASSAQPSQMSYPASAERDLDGPKPAALVPDRKPLEQPIRKPLVRP